MLPDATLLYPGIVFIHGGAPAPAPLSSSTMGDFTGRRGHYGRAPERQHREGRKVGRPRLVLQPEAPRERNTFSTTLCRDVGSSCRASECPDASFQLRTGLGLKRKLKRPKEAKREKRRSTLLSKKRRSTLLSTRHKDALEKNENQKINSRHRA